MFIIEDDRSDVFLAFSEFCAAKDKKSGGKNVAKLDCVLLVSKALKNEDDYEGFMILLHQAYVTYFSDRDVVSDDMRKKIRDTCIKVYWDENDSKPKPLPKTVKG